MPGSPMRSVVSTTPSVRARWAHRTRAFRQGDEHRQEGLYSGAPAPLAALGFEFVAKPGEAHRRHRAIPAATRDGLDLMPGFAGCVVMISDREARLVSV